jgi:acetylornithine deacetylase
MTDFLYESLARLVGFDTVSSRPIAPAMEYIRAELASRGFQTAIRPAHLSGADQANLVAWIGPSRPDGLIISGHIDTVPYDGQPGWTRAALALERAGDRIYGRGTTDMKGFVANCLDAMRRFDCSKLRRPLVFVFTASEEVGCLGAREVAPELAKILGETPRPRLAWIGEPTSYQVFHAHKSIVLFDVTVRGTGGHSSAPARGVNAIAVMARVIDAVGRLQEERRRVHDPALSAIFPDAPHDVLNFGTISGGMALNMIAQECTLRISYRSMPNADALEIHRELARRLAAISARDYAGGELRAKIEIGPALVVPPLNSPRGTSLERVLFDITGARDTSGAGFGTDGGWFAGSGIVSLICGPGNLDQAHQPDEFIVRDALESGTAKVIKVIERMCCGAPPA